MALQTKRKRSLNKDSCSLNNPAYTHALSVIYSWASRRREPAPWYTQEFMDDSYLRWAYWEIIFYLQRDPTRPPLAALEEFRDMMNHYSTMNGESSRMFSVAYDATQNIIDALIK